MSARVPFTHALSVLTDRALATLFADLGGTSLMLLQAPVIGAAVSFGWQQGGDHRPLVLNFVLALVAVWFGCINACRQLVKERPIILRERRLGIPASAYVLSQFTVLALVALTQCLILTLVIYANVPGFKLARPTLMLYTCLASLAGTGLGLVISALAPNQTSAVVLTTIALIPQIICSETALGPERQTEQLEAILPVSWAYDALAALLDSSWRLTDVLPAVAMLPILTVVFLTLATLILSLSRES